MTLKYTGQLRKQDKEIIDFTDAHCKYLTFISFSNCCWLYGSLYFPFKDIHTTPSHNISMDNAYAVSDKNKVEPS